MQLKLPFRLTRGVTVVLVIVLAHVTLAALFIGMRVRVELPDMGPVFATLMVDPKDTAPESSPELSPELSPESSPPRGTTPPASKPPQEVASSTSRKPTQAP